MKTTYFLWLMTQSLHKFCTNLLFSASLSFFSCSCRVFLLASSFSSKTSVCLMSHSCKTCLTAGIAATYLRFISYNVLVRSLSNWVSQSFQFRACLRVNISRGSTTTFCNWSQNNIEQLTTMPLKTNRSCPYGRQMNKFKVSSELVASYSKGGGGGGQLTITWNLHAFIDSAIIKKGKDFSCHSDLLLSQHHSYQDWE